MGILDPAISLDDWHRYGDSFGHQSHRIFFKTSGTGPPLLLLHGFPTCGWDWAWLEPLLKPYFTLYMPDLIDYGASKNGDRRYISIAEQADMIEAFLAHQSLSSIDLLCHDVGDTIGQELLARRKTNRLPFAIQSVVFLNGGMIPDQHRATRMQKILASRLGLLMVHMIRQNKMMASLSQVFGPETKPNTALQNQLWRAVLGVNGKRSIARRLNYIEERLTHRTKWVDALTQPDLPMMLVNGVDDPVSGLHAAKAFQETVPDALVVLLDKIGHYPQIEAPQDVARHLLNFHEKGPK